MPVDLDTIPIKSEEQKEWWIANRDDLSVEEREELFDELGSSNKYLYNTVAVGITVAPDEAGRLVNNLDRMHELLDADLSWGVALDWVPDLLEDKSSSLCDEVYRRLRDRGDTVYKDFGMYFLIAGNPESISDEILVLLDSDSDADIAVGLKSAEQEYADLPDNVVSRVHTLFNQQECLDTLIWFAAQYLDHDYNFWKELISLGTLRPETLPRILQCVRFEIGDEHLPGYLRLLRLAIEEDQVEDPRISILYTNFSHRTDLMADFTVWLNCVDSFEAQQLAERISDDNVVYLEALFDRIDGFDQPVRALFTLVRAGRSRPGRLVELTLQEFDEDQEWYYLELLRKAIGELFDDSETHQETVQELYDFLDDRYADEPFVPVLNRDRVGLEDQNAYDEAAALDQLKTFLLDLLNERDYGDTLLERLDDYDALSDHFESLVEQKLEQEERHPILNLLRRDSQLLDLLEDNWERIPEDKRNDLLADAGFADFLSEIEFLIALDDDGIAFDTEVPLHHYQEGNQIRDVDIVIDDDIYIDVLHPETWRPLSLSNRAKSIPNNAERKILKKFRDKFVKTEEMSTQPCFIALDIGRSEIDKEQVAAALHGSLQIQIAYDEETGEAVDERLTRDPDERLEGTHYFLDQHLNGVIWYRTDLVEEDDEVKPVLHGDVIPNPEHQDGEANLEYCQELSSRIFPRQA